MDDGQLWEDAKHGAPVAHCRAKIAADTAERQRREREKFRPRRAQLGVRWVA